jgi:hypothetical protein
VPQTDCLSRRQQDGKEQDGKKNGYIDFGHDALIREITA